MPEPADLLARQDPPLRVPVTFEKVLAAAAMAALCLITLGNVIARYFTDISFAFTEEYSIALMVVVTMLGASIATAADRNIRIVWFASLLPPGGRHAAEVIATVATIAMFALLAVLGGRLVWDEYRFEVTSPGLGEPQWIYTAALPVLAVVVTGRAVGHLVRTLKLRRLPPHDAVDPL
ncbi:TRAP transporter small permease [Blastochloris viridis]|uniref:TRAP transporter small permease protein n=1 Tax=Blastochloris viridis TaxID=1079 RepID=A0A0H5B9G0_BLAVI|nr:TRAP transporter small permease [Blastochloris viridis]ALK08939.1 Tripartite ATP-independent periplasmic transporters, DctQ component [Blastochloris viridis]BAR97664.1 TRAP-type C4-dicarboxylate transport system [Blastochloris viridis]CUU41600.1 TRAP-type C4-dicarboxylate transport system, small permease component [Blastochloris viridis]